MDDDDAEWAWLVALLVLNIAVIVAMCVSFAMTVYSVVLWARGDESALTVGIGAVAVYLAGKMLGRYTTAAMKEGGLDVGEGN